MAYIAEMYFSMRHERVDVEGATVDLDHRILFVVLEKAIIV